MKANRKENNSPEQKAKIGRRIYQWSPGNEHYGMPKTMM
jgi:hypothetical protein